MPCNGDEGRSRAYIDYTDRDPRVGFALTSSFSLDALGPSPSSSFRDFFRLSSVMEDEGRLPFTFMPWREYCSIGGVPMASDPCEDGDDRLAVMRCWGTMGGGGCWYE